MLWNLFSQLVSGILGLWLAVRFLPEVSFEGPVFIRPRAGLAIADYLGTLVYVGILLGLLNFFVKPILKTITFPLRVITLNLFSIIIALFLVWLVDFFSPALIIKGLKPLFFTTIIIWGMNFFLSKWRPKK